MICMQPIGPVYVLGMSVEAAEADVRTIMRGIARELRQLDEAARVMPQVLAPDPIACGGVELGKRELERCGLRMEHLRLGRRARRHLASGGARRRGAA